MKIALIDADLIGRKKHRFPNLVCEKLSGFWKTQGAEVELLTSYEGLENYDHIFIAKVFTDTPVPEWLSALDFPPALKKLMIRVGIPYAGEELLVSDWLVRTTVTKIRNAAVHIGGTGFFFDRAPNLPHAIEHQRPDYSLYDAWIESEVAKGKAKANANKEEFNEKKFRKQFREYTDYSIGFLTRGCFRHCHFCVNQKYNRVFAHSPLSEFYAPERKHICLLDDNFFGFRSWESSLHELMETGRKFKFKQGMDERLLNPSICEMLFSAKYDGDFTFAFDNIADYPLVEEKLKLIREHTGRTNIKFYVLVVFESTDIKDIENAFRRLALLMKYQCLPYIMRYQNKNETPWKDSRFKEMYVALARWCNQPGIFKKMSFREFCVRDQFYRSSKRLCSSMRAMRLIEEEAPEIAKEYFDLKFLSYR